MMKIQRIENPSQVKKRIIFLNTAMIAETLLFKNYTSSISEHTYVYNERGHNNTGQDSLLYYCRLIPRSASRGFPLCIVVVCRPALLAPRGWPTNTFTLLYVVNAELKNGTNRATTHNKHTLAVDEIFVYCCQWRTAVSYTHLDVYKRQLLYWAFSSFIPK